MNMICRICNEPYEPHPLDAVHAGVHPECLALTIVGHVYGVCSCTGWDTSSRTAALELKARMTAAIRVAGHPTITCPQCGRSSAHPKDIENRYCGACHQFHADMSPPVT